jgi:farnesyl-diphosphate farnesyltransferase
MSAPLAPKVELLNTFHMRMRSPEMSIVGYGNAEEQLLLGHFPAILRVLHTLPPAQVEVILDITRQMGAGMAQFVDKDYAQGTGDIAEYELYCHYVAGLVGEGLVSAMPWEGTRAWIDK